VKIKKKVKNMKKIKIVSVAVLLAAGAGYSALLDVNFEGQSDGSQPSGTSYLRPTVNSSTQAVRVVSSTLLGGNRALQYLDRAVNTGTASAFNYTFASNGAVVASFSFSPSYDLGLVGNYVSIGLSQQRVVNTSTIMFGEVRLRGDGSAAFYSGGSALGSVDLAVGSSNTVSMFLNDTADTIVYAGGTLAANTLDYWLNGSKIYSGASFGTGVGVLGTTNGMGQITVWDATSRTDLDYLIDNITVEAIPEPATIGMLLLGAVTVFAVRRRRG
jgi:hypothetical protein